jgi:GT2 family glycosyltransferase
MSEPQITVSILSWLLEDRLIKTLIQLPRTTSMPLGLCLHVQGEEQIPPNKRQAILDASSGFAIRDIYFTRGNAGAAGPRAELLKRSAKTPYIFITDNDMIFQENSLDELYNFLQRPENSNYGIIDLVHNYLRWHRSLNGTEVICTPVNLEERNIVDVDLIGAASMMMRQKVALIPNIIDTNYFIGTWDFDLCMNVRKAEWKIATLCDKRFIAINDKTYRSRKYLNEKVRNPIRLRGLRIFEHKWGFSSEYYPKPIDTDTQLSNKDNDTIVISRAIYNSLGDKPDIGVLDESRISLMQKYFINSLQNQTDLDFTLYIVVGPKDNEATKRIENLNWKGLNVKFIYTNSDLSKWKESVSKSKNWGREIDLGCPEDIVRKLDHPKTSIMARLDIDDWVAPGWIAHMKHLAKTIDEDHFLINYQVIGQAPDGRLYKFFAPHNRGRTSPFIALVQKSEPRISPYEDVHLNMGKLFDSVYTIPPSYTFMVVHGGNRSNKIYTLDRFLYIKESLQEQGQVESKQINQVDEKAEEPTKHPKLKLIKQKRSSVDWHLFADQDRSNIKQSEVRS